MMRGNPLRTYQVIVLVVAVLGFAIGLLVASLTGQYVAVFLVQLMIAAVLAAWYPRVKKQSAPGK